MKTILLFAQQVDDVVSALMSAIIIAAIPLITYLILKTVKDLK